jgi:predicted flap endonuclease-1-like 5' DNA nuclease
MFQGMGFLLTEIWTLLAAMGVIGLAAGWLIFAGRGGDTEMQVSDAPDPEVQRKALSEAHSRGQAEARAEAKDIAQRLERARSDLSRKDTRVKSLESELDQLRGEMAFNAPVSAAPEAPTQDAPGLNLDQDFDGDGAVEPGNGGDAPTLLDGPRDGTADELQKINGIGPKIEALCHKMGVYHYDQIAVWTAEELAWVDANLEGFKGRASRDEWINQAKALAKSTAS